LLLVLLAAGLAQAVAVSVGYRDFAYNGGLASRATGDSPQSKLWFAGGTWYGGLFKSGTNANNSRYHIWALNSATQVWADSGITVDPRDRTHADYLFDSAHNKLYVVSTKASCTSNPVAGVCNDAINVYRYSFNAANPLATRYALEAGFPVALIGGNYAGAPAISTGGAATVTIARDSLGQLFVAWTRRSATNAATSTTSIAYSNSDGNAASFADETSWSVPFTINAGEDGQDNISALVAFGGSKVGLYYTDKHAAGNDDGLFKIHTDGTAGTTWAAAETVSSATGAVDNQANIKTDGTKVFVVVKTALSGAASDQIRLFDRTSGGTWTAHGVSDVTSTDTRPQVAIDPTYNGGAGAAIVVMNDVDVANGSVYYKAAPLIGAGALTFTTAGKGTAFIGSSTDNDVEDPTTTKQLITQASGLVVEAADRTSLFYLHNVLPLSDTADNTGPTGTVIINGGAASTKSTAATAVMSATDANAVVNMRFGNSPDGATCPTTGSPALLTTGTTIPFTTAAQAVTLSGGDGVKGVCAQFQDLPGNWSAPVLDTINLDTTGPAGAVSINSGAASTALATVSLDVTAIDAGSTVTSVRISNSATVDGNGVLNGAGSETRAYAATQAWTLLPGDGLKTVYVQWQDSLGTWSAVSNDTITLASVDTTYTEVAPVRVLDSRFNNPVGATIFSHGVPQSFQVAGRTIGSVTIPADAVAITGNLTVVGATAKGFVSLGPDVPVVPTSSTINFPAGDTRANGVFVPLDGSGKLEATYRASAGKKTHLLLDVTGYFRVGTAGNRYFPVAPARFLDTRHNNPNGSHILNPSAPYAFQVGGRTVGATTIPVDAVAVTGNLTVTGQTKKGYLSLTPDAQPNPATSTLNFPVGDTRANNVTVKLGAGGNLYVVYKGSGKAHAIFDVTGYFRNDASGLTYVPVSPTRTVDTRIDQGIFNPLQASAPKSWTIRGFAGVESDAMAYTGNLTITGQTKKGYISVTPTPNASPTTSTINFPLGDTRANGIAAPINNADGKSSVVYKPSPNSGHVEFIVDITGYFH
jgi:hypothetical protein